jgi:hypothetical protein
MVRLSGRRSRELFPRTLTGLSPNYRASLQGFTPIPIDAIIQLIGAKEGDLPLMIEAKSAGDFTNTNKRRKEEAFKVTQ